MPIRTLALAFAVGVLACNGPMGLLPGGELSGEDRPIPSSWNFAGTSGQAQLETRPEDPYSVNINYTIVDGRLYINAGDTETEWAKNIAVNPSVRLRIDGVIYDLRAERVTDPAEIVRFGKVWTSQSMFLRDPSQFEEAWMYTLEPR